MAQKVNIVLVDDLDGSDAAETVSFALDGTAFEIDLSTANAARLREQLDVYVARARTTKRRRAGSSSGTPSEIRRWARENGLDISARGRVAASIRAAYEAAQ